MLGYDDIEIVIVILFVRMWVEITSDWLTRISLRRSSSSWGCELKYDMLQRFRREFGGHPLREDVSWNIVLPSCFIRCNVILFVRMWVEISIRMLPRDSPVCHPLREDVSWNSNCLVVNSFRYQSSSSWGCELKCVVLCCNAGQRVTSSSSWGCELK